MKRSLKSNLNKSVIKTLILSSLLALFSNASFAGLSGVKTIVITAAKANTSGYLQISEVIATQSGSGKDLALATEGAVATASSSYSNANANNAISGVGPDRYPDIFHSGGGDKTATLNITLAKESDLESIILYGRADGFFSRDIYDIKLKDASGNIIFSRSNLNASSASHSVSIDFTGDFSIKTKVSEISNNSKVHQPDNKKEIGKTNISKTQQLFIRIKKQYEEGKLALNSGDLNKAENIFTSILKQNPTNRVANRTKRHLEIIARKRKSIAKQQKLVRRSKALNKTSSDELLANRSVNTPVKTLNKTTTSKVTDITKEIPIDFTFVENERRESIRDRWIANKKFKSKRFNMNVTVSVDDYSILVKERKNLVKYAKSDIQKRLESANPDEYFATYGFKSKNSKNRYPNLIIHIRKDYKGRYHVQENMSTLNNFANSTAEEFLSLFKKTKAMYIAEQNGDDAKFEKLTKVSLAAVESATPHIGESALENLTALDKLALLFNLEAQKWRKVGGMSDQAIARKTIQKHKFPFKQPLNITDLSNLQREIRSLISDLDSKAKQNEKSAPKIKRGYSMFADLSISQQEKLAHKVLYPSIAKIHSKTIELLSHVPKTIEGFKQAYSINKWLRNNENDYIFNWQKLIRKSEKNQSDASICSKETSNTQVAFDRKTGKCFFEAAYMAKDLRRAWRLSYMREIDTIATALIEKEGSDAHLDKFKLAFGFRSFSFQYGLSKHPQLPPSSSNSCLYEKCNSNLIRVYLAEIDESIFTEKRKAQYLSTLEKKSRELMKKSSNSTRATQSEIAVYARDIATNMLRKLSRSAAKELESIDSNDTKAYRSWNKKTAKPIRLQAVVWRKLWDIGFGIGKKDNIASALGLSTFNDGYMKAAHYGGSPFVGISEIIYDAQYKWLTKAEQGSAADATLEFPTDWSTSGSYQIPKKAKKHYAQLLTPTELFFDAIGTHVGNAGNALATYGSQVNQLGTKIVTARKAFFACLPNCNSLSEKQSAYSRALAEKDLYYVQLSGQSGSLADQGQRSIAILLEGMSGSRGASLIDDGIPKICIGYFDRWLYKFGEANKLDRRNAVSDLFVSANKVSTGDFSALMEQGFKIIKRQHEAFTKTATKYRKYQTCRDQYEFDDWEDKHGEIEEDSSWFSF